jgi:hypothetical protein
MESQNHYRSAIPFYLDNPLSKPINFYWILESLKKIVLNDKPETERRACR